MFYYQRKHAKYASKSVEKTWFFWRCTCSGQSQVTLLMRTRHGHQVTLLALHKLQQEVFQPSGGPHNEESKHMWITSMKQRIVSHITYSNFTRRQNTLRDQICLCTSRYWRWSYYSFLNRPCELCALVPRSYKRHEISSSYNQKIIYGWKLFVHNYEKHLTDFQPYHLIKHKNSKIKQ